MTNRVILSAAKDLLFVGLLLLTFAPNAWAQRRDPDEDVAARDAYMRSLVAWPNPAVPPAVLDRAVQERIKIARQRQFTALAALAGQWVSIGPYGEMPLDGYYMSQAQLDAGRIVGIAFHPTQPNTWYIASAGGGVWKTSNGGASWAPLTDNQCSLHTGAIAVDPKNASIVYAGTGELDTWSFGCGVLRSTDAGSTWTPYLPATSTPQGTPAGTSMATGHLLIDTVTAGSTTSTIVHLGGGFGVYRSANSGQTWTRVLASSGRVNDVVQNPGDPNILYAGVGGNDATNGGVWRSIDKGLTWSKLPTQPPGLATDQVLRFALSTSSAAQDNLYVLSVSGAVSDQRKVNGGFIWNNVTQTWSTFNATAVYGIGARGDFGAQGEYDLLFKVDPADANRIFMGGVRLYRSENGGSTWRQVADNIHVDWHELAFDPANSRRMLAASDGGLFLSTDGGETWLSRNYGLAITQYYPGIALHPTNPGIVMGGTQDNGTHRSYGMPVWEGIGGGDGGYAAINQADPTILWRTCQWSSGGACIGRFTTTSGWADASSGISASDRGRFIPPLVMDPTTSTKLYFGTHRVYLNASSGPVSWAPISQDLTGGSGAINAIAPAKSNSQTVYAGTSDGRLRVTTDGGANWALTGANFPNRVVTDIWVDPADHLRAWATVAGYGTGHVWRTIDAGANWTNVSGNLPDQPVHAIVYVPSEDLLLAGTEIGVYQSADGGATWSAGPPGMPMVRVTDIAYNQTTGLLVAGTHGRGMWRYNLSAASAVLRGDVDRNGQVQANDVVLIQKALIGQSIGAGLTALPHGDADCNGKLEAVDALLALRVSVGLPNPGKCVNTSALRRP